MKTIKEIMLTSILCAFIALPAVVYANDQAEGKREGKHARMEKINQKIYGQLNLTEDQRKQLEANKQKQREGMKSSFEQMKSQREALHQELMKPELDRSKVDSINAQLKSLQSQIMDNRLNSILEVRKILTPEQFGKFQALMKEHRPKGKYKVSKDEKTK